MLLNHYVGRLPVLSARLSAVTGPVLPIAGPDSILAWWVLQTPVEAKQAQPPALVPSWHLQGAMPGSKELHELRPAHVTEFLAGIADSPPMLFRPTMSFSYDQASVATQVLKAKACSAATHQ